MVLHEMLLYFGATNYCEGWDKPSAEHLLAIAVEMGEDREAPR